MAKSKKIGHTSLYMKKHLNLRANIAMGLVFAFLVNTFGPLPLAQAGEFRLPAPGVMVHLSTEFKPPILKGIKVHPDNPFRFDFILDKGDSPASLQESTKLIKYFLASLTIPEKDLWVNLSPYEKDRIIPNSFGLTEMGRDLLAEDYMLKQITASLIYPEDQIGKKFWKRIYEQAAKKFGTTNIPVNTFNKVWIVPAKAVVYENAKAGTAYVVESKLKVMLEQDYLALSKHADGGVAEGGASPASAGFAEHAGETRGQDPDINRLGSQIIREMVIPELTREVNEGKNFAQLRQVYNSLVLATWYKKKIKDNILSQVYADKNKVSGVNIDDPQEKEKIYQRYLQAFKKGVYNYIKEEQNQITQQVTPRKYFSGGLGFAGHMDATTTFTSDGAMLSHSLELLGNGVKELACIHAEMTSIPSKYLLPSRYKAGTFEEDLGPMKEIYKVYSELLGQEREKLRFSEKEASRLIRYRTKVESLFSFGVAQAVTSIFFTSAVAAAVTSHPYITSASILLFSMALFNVLDESLFNLLLDSRTQAAHSRLSKIIQLNITKDTLWEDRIIYIIHEFAHLFKLPNHDLFANAYIILISKKLGYQKIIAALESHVNGYHEYNAYIAQQISDLFGFLTLAQKEAILRKFCMTHWDTNNKDTEGVLKDIASTLNDNDYNLPSVDQEDEFTYRYGDAIAQLVLIHFKNDINQALRYIYVLGKEGNSKKADSILSEAGDQAMRAGQAMDRRRFLKAAGAGYIASRLGAQNLQPPGTEVKKSVIKKAVIWDGVVGHQKVIVFGYKHLNLPIVNEFRDLLTNESIFKNEDVRQQNAKKLKTELAAEREFIDQYRLDIRDIMKAIDDEHSLKVAFGVESMVFQGEGRLDLGNLKLIEDTVRSSITRLLKGDDSVDIEKIIDDVLLYTLTPQQYLARTNNKAALMPFVGIEDETLLKEEINNVQMRYLNLTSSLVPAVRKGIISIEDFKFLRGLYNFSGMDDSIRAEIGNIRNRTVDLYKPIIDDYIKIYSDYLKIIQKRSVAMAKIIQKYGKDVIVPVGESHFQELTDTLRLLKGIRNPPKTGPVAQPKRDRAMTADNNTPLRVKYPSKIRIWKVLSPNVANAQSYSLRESGPGGIDLTPARMNLQTKMDSRLRGNDSGGIKFHLDPAKLAQLQNAPGFVPVIISIQPMANLKEFLLGKGTL